MEIEEIELTQGKFKISFVDEAVRPILQLVLSKEDMMYIAHYMYHLENA